MFTSDAGELVEGVIDLAFREGEGKDALWTVVDYKTDRDGAEALPAKYSEQIAEYEGAWRKFVPEKVTSVLVSTRVELPGTTDPEDRP